MSKPLVTALKITFLSFSVPLFFAGNAWAKTCTEAEVNDFLQNRDEVLFDCDANAIPSLIEALETNDARIRSHAVHALFSHVGIQDHIVVPALVKVLKNQDEDADIRQRAAYGLSVTAIEADTAIPALIEVLEDSNPRVREGVTYALRNSGNNAEIVLSALIKALEDSNANVRSGAAIALGEIGADTKLAIPALIRALKDDNASVRSYAAYALSRNDTDYKAAVPVLVETLKDQYAHVRSHAAVAIRAIGVEDKAAISPLIDLLKDKNPSVRSRAAYALGVFSTTPDAVLPALIASLQDQEFEVRKEAARSLKDIAATQYNHAATMQQTEQALVVVSSIKKTLADPNLNKEAYIDEYRRSVERSLESLHTKRQSFFINSTSKWISAAKQVWLAHAVFWLALILVYPKSRQVQAIFFWNPWIRRIMGLGYVGFALTWVPFLRRKLFAPFRESLLADADLENFKSEAYFENSTIKHPHSGELKPIRDGVEFKGQIVLEGASGLGKTMFLRHLCQHSKRVVVYLPATKCTDGVIEAIQKKLHGEEIKDPKFLQNLIYSGAIAICIDGLNEVSAETRAKIVEFTENYFKGDIILATQPMEWIPPATAKRVVMQPLARSHIQSFLHSRKLFIPDSAPVQGEAYEHACDRYLVKALDDQQDATELEAIHRILSNPMDLTMIAAMLAASKQPDLLRLQEQQYTVMAEEYQERHLGREFPLARFSEAVYQMRLEDETTLPETDFLEELLGMERHKMVISRQTVDRDGKPSKEWYFRHDKIAEFFILQTVLEHPERQAQHLGDPRFRGVYLMLANFLDLEDAIALREMLIHYAADTKDHTVSDTVVQLVRSRNSKLFQEIP